MDGRGRRTYKRCSPRTALFVSASSGLYVSAACAMLNVAGIHVSECCIECAGGLVGGVEWGGGRGDGVGSSSFEVDSAHDSCSFPTCACKD